MSKKESKEREESLSETSLSKKPSVPETSNLPPEAPKNTGDIRSQSSQQARDELFNALEKIARVNKQLDDLLVEVEKLKQSVIFLGHATFTSYSEINKVARVVTSSNEGGEGENDVA